MTQARASRWYNVKGTSDSDEHIVAAMIFEVEPSLSSPDDLKESSASAQFAREQYMSSRTGPLTILPNSICYLPFSHIVSPGTLRAISHETASLAQLPEQERNIRQRRFDPSPSTQLGQIEYIFDLGNWNPFFKPSSTQGKKYATCLQILQYPFSKGHIHVDPTDPVNNKPVINPQYYGGSHGGPIDLELMVHAARFAADRIAKASPLSNIIRKRVFPPVSADSGGGHAESDAYWKDWLIDTTITDWHPIGTCAMGGHAGMSPEGGGVVDERLRVYGTKGLRVIDASIMPLQISAHLQATVYAIGEKGAAMILEDSKLKS